MGTKPSFLLLTGRCCRPDRTRPVIPTVEHAHRDRTHCSVRSSSTVERAHRDRTHCRVRTSSTERVRSQFHCFGTSLDMIGHCTLCVQSSSAAASGHAENIAVMKNSVIGASGHYFAQHPVIATDACCCRATNRTCPVLLGLHPVTSMELVSS